MRFVIPPDSSMAECHSCRDYDEYQVGSYILCYQVANSLLSDYSGSWKIGESGITLSCKGLDAPLYFEFGSGTLSYKSLAFPLYPHYSCYQGIKGLRGEICRNLDLEMQLEGRTGPPDLLFNLFVKLIEIFHVRCGLQIRENSEPNGPKSWEIRLRKEGMEGWVGADGVARNRFGETVKIAQWLNLRPEKMATYLFGFNRYCLYYPSPLKQQI